MTLRTAAALAACALGLALVAGGSGCKSYADAGYHRGGSFTRRTPVVRPVVAVTDFENKASFSGQWNLGQGMAELLTAELLDTRQVEVLERKNLDDVVGEIVRQGQDLFRKEGRVERGRLKNAQYLVRGVVTDFTVTGDSSGWFAVNPVRFRIFGSKARVAMNVRVSDVASGQVLCSVKTDATASAGGFGGRVDYRQVSFGGDAFFRTPLGKATESAIARAVRRIVAELPPQTWQPRVAEADGRQVIVNGGRNVGLRKGAVFAVRESPRMVTDPVTGNPIETVPGRVTGRIKVQEVLDTAAHADLLEGQARRGDCLEADD